MIIVACKDNIDYDVEPINYGPFASKEEATEWCQDQCNHVFSYIIDISNLTSPVSSDSELQLKFPW